MKSQSQILLNKAWWKREQPGAIENKSGKTFLEAIEAFEKSNTALRGGNTAERLKNLEKAIVQVEKAAKEVVKEAKALAKLTKDNKEKLDLENTVAVMGSPLSAELNSARGSIDAAEESEDADDSDFGTAEEHGKYLSRYISKLKRTAFNFAVVMPSGDPAEMRMAFHHSKGGKSLAAALKAAGKSGRFTWGLAAAEALSDELVEDKDSVVEGDSKKVLLLALEGRLIPGLAKKVKLMLATMKVKGFSKVKLLVEGEPVEDDETPENELKDVEGDKVVEFPDLNGDDTSEESSLDESQDDDVVQTKGGEGGETLHPLWASLQQLKGRMLPLVGQAAKRYPDLKAQFAKFLLAVSQAEKAGQYDLAIAVLRDKIAPALQSASRMASTNKGDESDLAIKESDPSPVAAKRDVVNQSLTRVLDKTFGPDTGLLSCFGGGGSKTSGKSFFDAVKVTYPNGETPQNAELIREFSINMAVLQHLGSTVKADTPEHKALMNRTVGYLLKFANIPNISDLGWQGNPAQMETTGTYHRSGGTKITEAVTKLTAKSLGVPTENCSLVSDRRVLEEVRRNFSSEGEIEAVKDWGDNDYDRVLRKALAGEEVFIDASGEFKTALEGDLPAQSSAEKIIGKLKERAFANATAGRGKPGLTPEQLNGLGVEADQSTMTPREVEADKKRVAEELELKEAIRKDHEMALKRLGGVRIGGVMAMGEQHALVMFPFSKDAPLDGTADLTLNSTDGEKIRGLVGHSGLTAGPEQLLDHWVTQSPNVTDILRELGVTKLPKVEFPKNKKLDTFDDLRGDFLEDKTVKGFAELSKNGKKGPPPPYVKVTVDAMMSMIDGLQYGKHGVKVKSQLENAGLGALWSISLNKIQSLMAKATANKGSMNVFLDQIALIQEEIATLISVAKPYKKKDFEKGMKDSTDMFPEDFLGDKISADFTLKNSASRCFNSVLTACEDMKAQRQGSGDTAKDIHLAKRGLEVLVQSDSYYEPSAYVLEHAREHRTTGLETDALQDVTTENDFDEQLKALKKSQDDNNRAKLDTYLCEFHHNIAYGREKYTPEDVTKQVRKLVDADVVANPFTVAIDTTIAKTDEKSIKDFLAEFKDEIEDGRMNVAIYRSAQKFDQLGADTYNGGVMCVISKKQNDGPSPFQRALDGQGELPSEENLQGLTHLNLHAQEETNAYRTAIMENTRKIGDPNSGSKAAIPPEMLMTEANKNLSLLQIAVNEDPEAPFLDIKFPFVKLEDEPMPKNTPTWQDWNTRKERYESLYVDVKDLFEAQTAANPEETVTSTRASFGFQHANLTLIGPVKLRLNPGLEDEDRLKRHTDTLIDVNELMMTLKDDLNKAGVTDQVEFEKLAMQGDLISLPVLEAHRELKAVLADTKAKDKKKDEARLKMVQALCSPKACANPPRVLKLISEMSPRFVQDNQAEISRRESFAKLTLDVIKPDTREQRWLKQAAAYKKAGLVFEALDELSEIKVPFANNSKEKREFDEIKQWGEEKADSWSDRGERRIEAAMKARRKNDPIGVHEALKDNFSKNFEELRKETIDDLREWADKAYVSRNGKVAEELFALAETRIEQGEAGDADRYIKELKRMRDKKMPGLPDDLDTRLSDLKQRAKVGDARRRIDTILSEAGEYEKVGSTDEVAKRVKWLTELFKTSDDVATGAQKNEVERLRLWSSKI